MTPPPMPSALAYLWEAFCKLRARLAGTGYGPAPIRWADIDAFIRLTGRSLSPWEVDLVLDLDNLYLAEMAKKNESEA